MKRLALVFLLLCSLSALATTKLRLHPGASSVAGYNCTMDLALGGVGNAVATAVTNTAASGTEIQVTRTAGGTALACISEPLHAGFTLSGSVTCNPYVLESNGSANASIRCRLYKYSGGSEGAAIAVCQAAAEATTAISVKSSTCTPTSTVFATGDRVVAKLWLENCNATSGCPAGTMASPYTVTVHYGGPTGAADGDTYLQLNETVTFDPDGGAGGTPALFNYASYSNTLNFVTTPGTNQTLHVGLPNPSLSGNAILIFVQVDNSYTPTVVITDDEINTYQLLVDFLDTVNNQRVLAYVAPNAAAGTHKIDVEFVAGNGASAASVVTGEVRNLALSSVFDGAAGLQQTSTTVTSGSVTPLSSGDLVCEYVVQSLNSAFTAGNQSNISWVKKVSDRGDGQILQCGVYSSTSALNPQMTQSANQHYAAIGVFLKSSVAGTAPAAGIRVNSIRHVSLCASCVAYSDPTTVDFPAINGDLLVVMVASGGAVDNVSVTGITDSKGNSWTKCGPGIHASPHTMNVFYVPNANADGTLTLTVNQDDNTADTTLMMYAIQGAATSSACGATASTSGNQTANAQTLNGAALTPQAANSVILSMMQQEHNTEDSVTSPTGAIFDSESYTLEDIDGPVNVDQNAMWGHYYNGASTAAETWTAHFVSNRPQLNWLSYTVEFKAPAAAATARKRVIATSE